MADPARHRDRTTAAVAIPVGEEIALPAPAVIVDGARRTGRGAVPALDQHGAAIHAEFAAVVRSSR